MTQETKQALSMEGLRARREEILAIASRYGAYNVRVFGSVARNEATPASDVDLFIATQATVSMFDLVGLWLDLQALLGCSISLITDDDLPRDERFLAEIHKDLVPL